MSSRPPRSTGPLMAGAAGLIGGMGGGALALAIADVALRDSIELPPDVQFPLVVLYALPEFFVVAASIALAAALGFVVGTLIGVWGLLRLRRAQALPETLGAFVALLVVAIPLAIWMATLYEPLWLPVLLVGGVTPAVARRLAERAGRPADAASRQSP